MHVELRIACSAIAAVVSEAVALDGVEVLFEFR